MAMLILQKVDFRAQGYNMMIKESTHQEYTILTVQLAKNRTSKYMKEKLIF